MRTLIAFILVLGSQSAFAKYCKDTDKGQDAKVAGKIVYSLGDENCLGDSCYTQYMKEHDRCLDAKTVLEFSCDKGLPVEKEIVCSKAQVCRDGACVSK